MAATIGGYHIPGDVGWTLVAGVSPHERVFELPRESALALFKRAQGGETFTLTISSPGYGTVTVEKLYIVGLAATRRTETLGIVVADRRWLWPSVHIKRDYNLRRRSGERRRLKQEGELIDVGQIDPVVDDVTFAPWSLYPPDGPQNTWDAAQVLEDIAAKLVGAEFRLDGFLPTRLPIESLVIDDPGDAALLKAIAQIPGTDVFIDYDGAAVFFNAIDGSERAHIESAGSSIRGSELATYNDLSLQRWSEIHVLFTREIELRVNSLVEGGDVSASRTEDSRECENVLPCPDPTLALSDGRVVVQGTWITFTELFAATAGSWGDEDVDDAYVRQNWANDAIWDVQSGAATGIEPDPIIVNRIAAIFQHYRQTYRLDRKFRDRLATIRAYRVAIQDLETGTRAPSPVYTDYYRKATQRAVSGLTGAPQKVGYNVVGYATLLKDAKRAPAIVTILDEDQGIFRIDFAGDPAGAIASFDPSQRLDDDGEDARVSWDPRDAGDDGAGILDSASRLALEHRIAVVITCIPASPNDERQLHDVTIRPFEVEPILRRSLGPCKGPVLYVRVPPEVETARFAWLDSDAEVIESALGMVAGGASLANPVDEDALKAFALGVAATRYGALLDRWEGGWQGALHPSARPSGAISGVSHSLEGETGVALTDRELRAPPLPEDPYVYVPANLRRAMVRLAS